MDEKQLKRRTAVLLAVMAAMLLLFVAVLYDLQVVRGADFYQQSTRNITNTETVEAARGQLLDRYGRVLVSSRATYQVKLDTSLMGGTQGRNRIILELISLAREQGVEWQDSLPISKQPPYVYLVSTPYSVTTVDEQDNATTTRTRLGRLTAALSTAKRPFSDTDSAQKLMDRLRAYFELDESISETDGRALIGVLYELALRSRGIDSSEYYFAEGVDIDFISAVKEHSLDGVRIATATVREYNTPYAAHLLGRVGSIYAEDWEEYRKKGYSMNAQIGRDGFERAFEEYLRGTAGTRALETDTGGKVISEEWLTVPDPGCHVITTIDSSLQETVEQSLARRIPELPSEYTEGAAAVVIEVKDGGVLASASYPTYDLTTIYQDAEAYSAAAENPLRPFLNRALQEHYSPGSTFKMVTGVAALAEGATTPGEKILDTGRFRYPEGEHYPYGDYHPGCWIYLQQGRNHGWEDMAHALQDSCNIYFFTMADRLGIDVISRYARMFGLGARTGVELPEVTGYVAGPETSEALGQTWYGGNLLSAAIGQGNTLCTPIQLANYIATLVNGGRHNAAHFLKMVKSSDFSEVIYEYDEEPLDVIDIDPEDLEAVKRGMYLVATEGSPASYLRDLPVGVGAKTGTAQVGMADTEANAVFVCFAPYDEPEIAISIVAEHGGSGTELAAIAADILRDYFGEGGAVGAVEPENTLLP